MRLINKLTSPRFNVIILILEDKVGKTNCNAYLSRGIGY